MNWKSVIVVAAIVSACAMGFAQTKVAYVDIDRVTAKSKQVNDAMASVEKKVKGIQGELAAKQKLLDSLNDEIRKGQGVLAESELAKKRDEARKLKSDTDELEFQAKRKMEELDQTFFDPMLKRIVFAIQDVAHDKKIDLVVRGEAVLYGSKAADITDAVIDKLNSSDGSSSSSRTDRSDKSDKSNKSDNSDKADAGDKSVDSDAAGRTGSSGQAEESSHGNDSKSTGDSGSSDSSDKPASAESSSKKVDILPEPVRSSTRPVDRQKD